MSIPLLQVDAFTIRPFAGNSAAVCILSEERDAEWMQAVAMEMNLSETAFVIPQEKQFGLRWFTPAVEVDLCGHATLATAHALWDTGHLKSDEAAVFSTRSGILTARQRDGWIFLDFPAKPETQTEIPPQLAEALGTEPRYVGKSEFDYLAELASAEEVRSIQPNYDLIRQIPSRGVIVTSRDDSGEFDFVSRFFAPNCGIDEDPVCGSAHCTLGPFWSQRLDKDDLLAHQSSPRGGILRVGVRGERIEIGGQAVTVMRGELAE